MADIYSSLAIKIIQAQENVMGSSLAWSQAREVVGIEVTDHNVQIKGDGKQTLEKLVDQYAGLFGRASVEVCKSAVRRLIVDVDPKQIPQVLLP